jgi:DNA polymerase
MPTFTDLPTLRSFVTACHLCSLRDQATHVVFGEGAPTARIVFCGEAPGADEDLQGRPFVGASGQLLTRMMTAMGFDRSHNAYILNVIKCRPPENRTPTPDETATCVPHTIAQLGILRPAILVTLGGTATQAFFPQSDRISRLRGQWLTWHDIAVMPTYHPAAMLRNAAWKRDAWEDMKQVIDYYRTHVDPTHVAPGYPIAV